MVAAPLGVAAVRLLLESRGAQYVAGQVARGALRLTQSAYQYLMSSAPMPVGNEIAIAPAPAAVGATFAGSAKFQGDIRIKHREMLFTANLAATTVQVNRVNPVDGETFPYLSAIARNYEEYKFHGLKFGLVSGAGTSTAGRWYIAWDPDSTDPTLGNNQAIMAMRHSLSAAAWQSGEISVPAMSGFRLCEHFTDDLKDYGQFLLWTQGATGNADVYVEYDVTLRNPESGSPATVLTTGTNSSFFTNGLFRPLGPGFVQPTSPPVARAFKLARGYYSIQTYTIGTGLVGSASTFTNTTVQNERRSTFGTTESWHFIVVACNNNPDETDASILLGDSWSTITNMSVVITPLTVGQYNTVTASM